MSGLTRRQLVRLGLGTALGWGLGAWRGPLRAQDPDRPVLVAIMLRGALDGLSVLVPHRDPHYARVRPTIRIAAPGAAQGALALTEELGLHPALAPLLPLHREGRLAFIPAFGSPAETRSHFEAQRLMELGRLRSDRQGQGFLSRALAELGSNTHGPSAVAASSHLPLVLRGGPPVLALGHVMGAADPTGQARAHQVSILSALYPHGGDPVLDAGRQSLDMLQAIEPALALPLHGEAYPPGPLGPSLAEIARVIRARLGIPMFYAEAGSWDTHAGQGGAQGLLAHHLGRLAAALAAFEADLGDAGRNVVVVCFTEFGRTVQENGSRGTDHGHGSVAMVLGRPVAGGRVVGAFPSLAPDALFEGRDLPVMVDYRDLFGELLVRHLGLRESASPFPDFTLRPERFPGVIGGA